MAAGFAKNANSVNRKNSDLVLLASRLPGEVKQLISEFVHLVGDYAKMRLV